ncbi:MAG TPA: isoprenylcysteine carboxylmethyltransferase family protein [Edaphobacter sp.]|jgi:protein-S-isoprenylcysteine O-methyltransferase Ste14|nr:isoprenylcysteine carboxylmethyltransferase family protein [Edaphobacter sp.]
MFYVITIDQIVHWTRLLYLLLAAVWLGSLPFVKRNVQQQSIPFTLQNTLVLTVGIFLLFGSPSTPDWFNQPLFTVTFPIALAGLGLAICGIGLSIWARLIIGEYWSSFPSLKQNHRLIMTGPYRFVRHPIYTGLLLAFLGSALQYGLVRSFLAVLTCAVGLYLKVTAEEEFMVQRFGEAYLRYCRKVSALVPYLF